MKLKDSIIIILLVIIAIGIGVFVGYKVSENKKDDNVTNSGITDDGISNNENYINENVETDFSLDEAKKMMSKYLYSTDCNPEVYIDDLTNDYIKTELAINSTKKSDEYDCSLVYGNNYGEETHYNGAYACIEDDAMGSTPFYKYNDILETKKVLFGNNESLAKKTFDSASGSIRYEYNSTNNIYAGLQLMGGGACPSTIKNSIESAKVLNDTLKIVVVKKEYNLDDSAMPEMTTVKSEKKIQYVFKKQNNNYYLAEINKLN